MSTHTVRKDRLETDGYENRDRDREPRLFVGHALPGRHDLGLDGTRRGSSTGLDSSRRSPGRIEEPDEE
jgi:hypothetical protein